MATVEQQTSVKTSRRKEDVGKMPVFIVSPEAKADAPSKTEMADLSHPPVDPAVISVPVLQLISEQSTTPSETAPAKLTVAQVREKMQSSPLVDVDAEIPASIREILVHPYFLLFMKLKELKAETRQLTPGEITLLCSVILYKLEDEFDSNQVAAALAYEKATNTNGNLAFQ